MAQQVQFVATQAGRREVVIDPGTSGTTRRSSGRLSSGVATTQSSSSRAPWRRSLMPTLRTRPNNIGSA